MNDDELTNTIKHHLDKKLNTDSEDLDQQLKQARIAALDKAYQPSVLSRLLKPVPVSAFITACVLVAVISIFNQQAVEQNDPENYTDIEMLTTEDNLEFYEDLEFYEWLLLEDQRSS